MRDSIVVLIHDAKSMTQKHDAVLMELKGTVTEKTDEKYKYFAKKYLQSFIGVYFRKANHEMVCMIFTNSLLLSQ